MSQPLSREELKQYCLRTLGKPVIEINVDDDQLEDRIDEGLQYFQEYHFDSIEKIYHRHQITGSTVSVNTVIGDFSNGEIIEGQTSNASATLTTSNSSFITFKNHKDSTGISNNNVSSSFSSGETIIGKKSGSSAIVDAIDNPVVFGDVDNKYIPLTDSITGVISIFDIQDTGGGQTTSDMFSFRYQFHLNELPYLTATSIINYQMSMQHIQLLNDIFVGKKPIRFNRHQSRLYLDMDWVSDIDIGEYIVVEAYRIIDPSLYGKIYNDMFLKRYVTALFKKQWGANLSKFNGVAMIGGVSLNGQQLYSEALTDIEKLEQEIRSSYELNPAMMIG